MNFCKDCKYCELVVAYQTYKCTHPSALDPVTGASANSDCNTARSKDGFCGPGGKHWEAKELPIPAMPTR
jgi:hypothetical protein